MKFRSTDVDLFLWKLKSNGYRMVKIEEQEDPRAGVYIMENRGAGVRVSIYRTYNSWVEVSYSKLI